MSSTDRPKIRLDAVAVSTPDMARTVAFYETLGFEFEPGWEGQDHVEPITAAGAVRLMIDTDSLMESILGEAPRPSNHSSFALDCGDAAGVDAAAQAVAAAGFSIVKEPWDAFWGQRYAIVMDPGGYGVDLFAEL